MSHDRRETRADAKPLDGDKRSATDVRPKQTVDLRALSEHLGLSKGTISRALNGYPEIAERTRIRVLQAAQELGYKPNRAARRLATGRNDLIAYIGVGADWMTVDRAFLGSLSENLAASGYGLLVSLADSIDHACEAMTQLLDEQRVDGFVFNSPNPFDGRLDLVSQRSVPSAIVGASGAYGSSPHLTDQGIPVVGLSDSVVLDGLVDYLTSMGHSAIGYFGCDAPDVLQMHHTKTLAAAAGNRNASFSSSLLNGDRLNVEQRTAQLATESAQSLSKRATNLLKERPTAVFCGCERTVVALYMAAREQGLSVPAELSIIGIGSSQLASWLSGGLSTVSWSLGEAGRLAADCVVAQVEGNSLPELQAGIEATFLARASHGPAPQIR